jgi:two-component system, OmpR family, sensor kinase
MGNHDQVNIFIIYNQKQVPVMNIINKRDKKQIEESGETGKTFFQEVSTEFLVHELKNPVSVIEASVQILLDRKEKYGSLTPMQEKTLARVLRNTKKTRGILNNLLEIGRADACQFTYSRFKPARVAYNALICTLELMLPDLVRQVESMEHKKQVIEFLSEKGIGFDIDPCIADVRITQDKIKFSHIISNLFKNAFCHQKGEVKITIRQDHGFLLLRVFDNGPGINSEDHEIIFQRYTQIKQSSECMRTGHGLGLAGARIIARSLGGDIRVESKKGKGAQFEFALPFKGIHKK